MRIRLRRRRFGQLMMLSTLIATVGSWIKRSIAQFPPQSPIPSPSDAVSVALTINGTSRSLTLESRVTLLDALRETIGLTGSKKGCDHGQCGACTVIVDGRRVLACLTLTAQCEGKSVTTIKGLANGDELHPMQAAFVKHDGFQCGYCTPGQICSAVTLMEEAKNIGAPSYMRSPGEKPGTFALESAIDEMAYELNIDPVEFRIRNHTTINPLKNLPFSGENLLECYGMGAEKFGWARRKIQPRQTHNGNYLIGMGMATATHPESRSSTTTRLQIMVDGSVKVLCATQDLGAGTYTIMAQTAADVLGIPVEKIAVELGDTRLPPGPSSVASRTAASVTPAVLAAGEMLRKDLIQLAIANARSELYGRKLEEIAFIDAKFFVRGDPSKADSYANIMQRSNKTMMESCATAMPAATCMPAPIDSEENNDTKKYSFHSFGAQFTEVWVDEDLGLVRVKRVTSIHDVGRVMNEKTARSQIIGGVIFAIGGALMEEAEFDQRFGNPVHRTLADYHVPVQTDVPKIDVHFINKPDPHISPIGARGAGQIGAIGVSAAIANAVFNATGKRLRDLPLTPDKLL